MTDPRISLSVMLPAESSQRREEGCSVVELESRVDALAAEPDSAEASAMFDRLAALEPAGDWSRREPSEPEGIRWGRAGRTWLWAL